MNFTDLTFSFEAMRWIVMAALGLYAWLIGRQSASAAELLELRTRLTTLEVQMTQVPPQKDFHDMAERLAQMAGAVEVVAARIEPLSRSVDRMNDYLLNQK